MIDNELWQSVCATLRITNESMLDSNEVMLCPNCIMYAIEVDKEFASFKLTEIK